MKALAEELLDVESVDADRLKQILAQHVLAPAALNRPPDARPEGRAHGRRSGVGSSHQRGGRSPARPALPMVRFFMSTRGRGSSDLTRPRGARRAALPMLAVALAGLAGGAGPAVMSGQGRGGAAPVPRQTARQQAPVDLTGTWVSVVTEDWRWRMVTPPKGDVASIPVSARRTEGGGGWNRDADNAEREPVQGVRRRRHHAAARTTSRLVAGRSDAQIRVRRRHADAAAALRSRSAAAGGAHAAGFSFARVGRSGRRPRTGDGGGRADPRVTGGGLLARDLPGGGGGGLRGGPPPRQQAQIDRGGDLKVVTTNFREGYLRKNGVPYSEQATITDTSIACRRIRTATTGCT